MDRVGTWETSHRPQSPRRSRAATGSRGDEAVGEGVRRAFSYNAAANINNAGLMLFRTPIDGSEPCERLVIDHDVPPITRATTTLAVPVLALTGATSYWASVVASPPGHMSGAGA